MTHRHKHLTASLRYRSAHQRGSILVQFALLIMVLITILGIIDIGYMHYAKRDLQRAADLAAMEAVQNIDYQPGAGTNSCVTAGGNSLDNNWPSAVGRDTNETKVLCGNWDPAKHAAPLHFATTGILNAAHVTVQGTSPTILPGPWDRTLFAEAVARRNEPVAAFQVGSQLLRFDNTALLGSLLGAVGLNITELTLLDSGGLANAQITPSGLLDLLGLDVGVGGLSLLTPEGVAQLDDVSLLNLLELTLDALRDDALCASVGLVIEGAADTCSRNFSEEISALDRIINSLENSNALEIPLEQIKIPLAGVDLDGDGIPDQGGLLAFLGIGRDDPLGAAADVRLGLGDLIKTAIGIGVNGHAIEIPELNILGLVKAKATVVEPPTIAIGPVGTKGYSAQVRLNLDIDTRNLLGGVLNFLVENILGIRVNLPIGVDVVTAQAELTNIQCRRVPQTIDLEVNSSVANICVGKMQPSSIFSHTNRCEQGLAEEELIKLLHIPVLSGKLHIPALEYFDNESGLDMVVGETRSTEANQLELGNTVDNLVTNLLNLLSGLFRQPAPSPYFDGTYNADSLIDALVDTYLEMPELRNQVKDNAGFYNVAGITNLMINGATIVRDGQTVTIEPLVNNFTFSNAIPTSCVLFVCPPSQWQSGSFSQAFNAYANTPYSLLDVVGIPTLGNNFQSCAGLLSSLLNRNNCIQHNLKELLRQHKNQVGMDNATTNSIVNQIMNPNTNEVQCNGALCMLLQPVLQVLKPVLNGVGSLLTSLLDDVLGLELGRTDVKALAIECDTAQLVY